MLKLKKLYLSNIGRFVEDQEIDFDPLGNLIQVDAVNNNTGGSSGSGKSTIFNALDFLLGLNDLPISVLQSRLTKDPISVRGVFDLDGKPLLIARNKKGLTIDLDGEVTEGSSKITEEKLDQIIGMPRDLFRKILHKRQKEGGFFLDFTPKKMSEFLTDALNLVQERKKLEKIELKLSSLNKEKTALQNNYNILQSSLRATQDAILAIGLAPIKEVYEETVLELKGKLDVTTKKYKEIEEKQKQETQELEKARPSITIAPFDSSERIRFEERRKSLLTDATAKEREESDRISAIKSSIQSFTLEQNQLSYQVRDADTAKVHATEHALQIKKIRSSLCPTCDQSWVTETAKTKENELLAKLASCKEKISAGALAAEKIKEIASKLETLKEELTPRVDPVLPQIRAEIVTIDLEIQNEKTKESRYLATQNETNRSLLQSFSLQQADLRQKHSLELDQVRGQLDIERRTFDAAVAKIKYYNDAKARYDSSLTEMKAKEAEYSEKLDKVSKDLEEVESRILLAEELHKIVKTFISCSFDDALDAIGDTATRIIRNIPNMANATVQFDGQKETQDGKVKEEVNAVISIDGDIGIPIKSLSGGERSAVDLAVDLAVIDLIETQSNIGSNILILDEPFTGLDSVGIEMTLEILKNSNINKKIVIVDHNPEIKQMVSDKIVVVRDGNTSKIELNQP